MIKNISNNKTNIVYFTSDCQLNCTYCYENLKDVRKSTISLEKLREAADEAIDRESDEQTFFILFGGEPLLEWDKLKYFMDYAVSKKENVQFNIISNGLKFKDDNFVSDYINNVHYKAGRITLDISFDGKGNKERIFHNNKESTSDILYVLALFKLLNMPYRIRYTVHSHNIGIFVDDIINLINSFNPSRIILGAVTDQIDINIFELGKTRILNMWNSQKIKVPICELVCDTCNGCDIQRNDLSLYTSTKQINRALISEGKFSDFKKKEKV